jgi:hypothetical protein
MRDFEVGSIYIAEIGHRRNAHLLYVFALIEKNKVFRLHDAFV